jgi:hypothetical protein
MRSHLHDLVWVPSISPWTSVSFPDHLQLEQGEVASTCETAKLIQADVTLRVPPGLRRRSCVRNAQSDLDVFAGYNGKSD